MMERPGYRVMSTSRRMTFFALAAVQRHLEQQVADAQGMALLTGEDTDAQHLRDLQIVLHKVYDVGDEFRRIVRRSPLISPEL
jgi:hypothetical protein